MQRDAGFNAQVGTNLRFDFTGNVGVLIGAGSGLTRGIALALGQAGSDLVIADVNGDGVEETAREIRDGGGSAVALQADVANLADMEAVFAAADERGPLKVMVNGAYLGSGHLEPERVAIDDWRRVIDVNVNGAFIATQLAGRRMIAHGKGGSIVNFSSIAGSSALGRGNYSYSVSKGAINQLTRELAIEWGRYGIRVNAVQPCQFLTPGVLAWLNNPDTDSEALHRHFLAGIPMGRLGQVDDIIGPVLFLLSDAAAMVTGSMVPVDGGNLAMNAAGGGPVPVHPTD